MLGTLWVRIALASCVLASLSQGGRGGYDIYGNRKRTVLLGTGLEFLTDTSGHPLYASHLGSYLERHGIDCLTLGSNSKQWAVVSHRDIRRARLLVVQDELGQAMLNEESRWIDKNVNISLQDVIAGRGSLLLPGFQRNALGAWLAKSPIAGPCALVRLRVRAGLWWSDPKTLSPFSDFEFWVDSPWDRRRHELRMTTSADFSTGIWSDRSHGMSGDKHRGRPVRRRAG